MIAADQAGRFEGPHTAQARRRRDHDPPRQPDIGHAAIRLQQREDLPVDPVELWPAHAQSRDPVWRSRNRRNNRNFGAPRNFVARFRRPARPPCRRGAGFRKPRMAACPLPASRAPASVSPACSPPFGSCTTASPAWRARHWARRGGRLSVPRRAVDPPTLEWCRRSCGLRRCCAASVGGRSLPAALARPGDRLRPQHGAAGAGDQAGQRRPYAWRCMSRTPLRTRRFDLLMYPARPAARPPRGARPQAALHRVTAARLSPSSSAFRRSKLEAASSAS